MGDTRGFLKVGRKVAAYRPVCERVKDFCEVSVPAGAYDSREQASRCMDCGTPFCHWGCPIGNYIPEWNDLLFRGDWKGAFRLLAATNNLPEVTGRLCPASCEYSCVLGINDEPVAIRENELAIIEYAFREGLVRPNPPIRRTGKRIAVVGSGPAGISCADQLNKAGHSVTVFEKDDKIGGIMRYGIPDFKLEKWILDRRARILEEEGIVFNTGICVGRDYSVNKLKRGFDALCLAGGSRVPRDLEIEGRGLKGIYFAMDYLIQANRRVAGDRVAADGLIDAKGKRVVVIGGGDTGSDCVGVANRQGARCVIQIELLAQPPECRGPEYPWPKYPLLLRTSSSHEEGAERKWSILTKRFIGDNGRVDRLSCVRVEFVKDAKGCGIMKEVPANEFEIEADMVILAMGFLHPDKMGMIEDLGVLLDGRGNIKTGGDLMTSVPGIFSAGDMHSGQSLVVRAISEGRKAAYHIDTYLTGGSFLPVV